MNAMLLYAVVRVADSRTPDAELLTRFTRDRDEAAFEELVRRHGPLVWGVCRQLLSHAADTEDAFQAVFLALVRGAATIRAGQALPSWLHEVAVRVATRVKRTAVRRRQREQRAAIPEADRPVPDAAWSALLTAVHEEVQRLPDPERTAFVLCELEGVRQPDAAARLGWPLGTLSGRLCKARQRLLDLLARRGIGPAVLAVGGLAGSAGSVPAALVSKVTSFPTAAAAGVSSTVAALARGLSEGVTMRTKLMAAGLLVATAIGFTGSAIVLSKADAQTPAIQKEVGELLDTPGQAAGGEGAPGSRAAQPGGAGAAAGGGPAGQVQAQGPGVAGEKWKFAVVGNTQWEYKFVDLKSDDRDAFEKAVTTAGNEGWEFAGSERLRKGNDAAQLVLVFKKQKGGTAFWDKIPGVGGGGKFGGFDIELPDVPGLGGKFGGLGGGGVEARVFHLIRVKAEDVVAAVEKAFPKKALKIIAEPHTNMVIVVADSAALKDIAKTIDALDAKPTDKPKPTSGGSSPAGTVSGVAPGKPAGGQLSIVTLKNAKAEELATVLKKVFPTALVTPEPRTNQLIIQADRETTVELQALVERLDVKAP